MKMADHDEGIFTINGPTADQRRHARFSRVRQGQVGAHYYVGPENIWEMN
jgi:hypothetical protein